MGKIIKYFEAEGALVVSYERDVLEAIESAVQAHPQDLAAHVVDILAEARAEAERVVREAYAEGCRRGVETGRQEFSAAMDQVQEAAQEAVAAMRQAREDFLENLEPQVLALVEAVSARVLHGEARTDPRLLRATIRAALEHLTESEQIVLRVNPEDRETLRQEGMDFFDNLARVPHVQVVPDEAISRGGCVADTGTLQVDARIEVQLERILDALKAGPEHIEEH